MTAIYLIRHGQPDSGWNAHQNPGLSDLGRQQAHEAARDGRRAGGGDSVAWPLWSRAR